jgi:hypothetical protein
LSRCITFRNATSRQPSSRKQKLAGYHQSNL